MLLVARRVMNRVLPPQAPLTTGVRRGLIGVVVAGAAARVGFALSSSWQPQSFRDPGAYLLLGNQLARGEGYVYPGPTGGPTAYYPPGYPMALGVVRWFADLLPWEISSFGLAIGLNVILSILTIVLVFELVRRILDPAIAVVAAGAIALWPNIVVHSGVVLTETLFLFLFVLMLLVALPTRAIARNPGWARMATVGVLFGMVGMVRPTSFVVAPMFLLLWWRQGVAVAVKRCAVVGAMVLVLVLPWTIRNAVRMDSLVLVSTNTGDNLCIGHNADAEGGYAEPPACAFTSPEEEALRRPDYETVRQEKMVRNALSYIKGHPVRVITTMPSKIFWTLKADTDGLFAATDYMQRRLWDDDRFYRAKVFTDWYYGIAGVSGAIGLLLLTRRADSARRRLFVVTMSLGQLAAPALTFGDLRFKFPIYPALAIGVGVLVMSIARRRLPEGDADEVLADTPNPAPDQPTEALVVA